MLTLKVNPLKYLQIDHIRLEVHNYYDDFILLKNSEVDILPLIGQAITEAKYDFIKEVIATEVEILLKIRIPLTPHILTELSNLNIKPQELLPPYELQVHFGEDQDWAHITSVSGLSKDAYIKELLASTLSVAMYGFMPGFVYLRGLPEHLHVPRKPNPDQLIPASSFAIGSNYAGIYSVASPGGWHVIGTVINQIFDKESMPPLHLKVGQQIKIKAISKTELSEPESHRSTK